MKKVLIMLLLTLLLIGCAKEEITEIAQGNYEESNGITNQSPKSETQIIQDTNTSKDTQIVEEFNVYEQEIATAIQTNNQSKAKEIFITIIDFLFYGTEIKGVTLNDISEDTKTIIMNITNKIDTRIESKWPDYKESIKDKVDTTMTFTKEKYKELSNATKQKIKEIIGSDSYNIIKEEKDKIKENAKDIYNDTKAVVKEKATEGLDNLKKWYETLKTTN